MDTKETNKKVKQNEKSYAVSAELKIEEGTKTRPVKITRLNTIDSQLGRLVAFNMNSDIGKYIDIMFKGNIPEDAFLNVENSTGNKKYMCLELLISKEVQIKRRKILIPWVGTIATNESMILIFILMT